jgi:hypothetical protein
MVTRYYVLQFSDAFLAEWLNGLMQVLALTLVVCWDQALSQGRVQVCAVHPVQIWMPLEAFRQIPNTNMPIIPPNNLWHPTASACCLFWTVAVVNSSFSKMYVLARCVQCYRANFVVGVLILWSCRRRFLCLRIRNIQGDQKVSVHLMSTIHFATWLNLTAWQPTTRARWTLDSH